MQRWLFGPAVMLSVQGAPAFAAPTFLECQIAYADGTSRVHVDVNLNEQTETAGFTIRETGYSLQKLPAVFAPQRVTWSNSDSLGSTDYEVDRASLEIREARQIGGQEVARRLGQCSLPRPTVKRKF